MLLYSAIALFFLLALFSKTVSFILLFLVLFIQFGDL